MIVWVLIILFGAGNSGRAIDASLEFTSATECEIAAQAVTKRREVPYAGTDSPAICVKRTR